MFSLATTVARRTAPLARHQLTLRAGFAQSVKEGLTATDAWTKSCYSEIDYTISDDAAVYDAVQKFAAYNIGKFFVTGLFSLLVRLRQKKYTSQYCDILRVGIGER